MKPPAKCILITGGTGFLGSHLVASFVAEGHQVVVLKRPTSSLRRIETLLPQISIYDIQQDPTSLVKVFEENPIDTIVHCATHYGKNFESVHEVLESNLLLPLSLLELGKRFSVRTFINSDTMLDKRINPYSMSKTHFSEWLDTFSQSMVCANVVLQQFYGSKDDPSKFVTTVIHAFLKEEPILPLTPGEQRRDFIHIVDVVRAFERIIQALEKASPGLYRFEVGSGRAIKIKDFVEMVQRLSGNRSTFLDFGSLPYRENEMMDAKVDLSHLRTLEWEPSVSIEEGIARTINEERDRLNL